MKFKYALLTLLVLSIATAALIYSSSEAFNINTTSEFNNGTYSNTTDGYLTEVFEENNLTLGSKYHDEFSFDDADSTTWAWEYNEDEGFSTVESNISNGTLWVNYSYVDDWTYTYHALKEVKIAEDFDMQIDFMNYTPKPGMDEAYIGLCVSDDHKNPMASTSFVCTWVFNNYGTREYTAFGDSFSDSVPTNDTEGKIRLKRTVSSAEDSTYYWYYWNSTASNWVEINHYTYTGTTNKAMSQYVSIWTGAYEVTAVPSYFNVKIDNFKINSGKLTRTSDYDGNAYREEGYWTSSVQEITAESGTDNITELENITVELITDAYSTSGITGSSVNTADGFTESYQQVTRAYSGENVTVLVNGTYPAYSLQKELPITVENSVWNLSATITPISAGVVNRLKAPVIIMNYSTPGLGTLTNMVAREVVGIQFLKITTVNYLTIFYKNTSGSTLYWSNVSQSWTTSTAATAISTPTLFNNVYKNTIESNGSHWRGVVLQNGTQVGNSSWVAWESVYDNYLYGEKFWATFGEPATDAAAFNFTLGNVTYSQQSNALDYVNISYSNGTQLSYDGTDRIMSGNYTITGLGIEDSSNITIKVGLKTVGEGTTSKILSVKGTYSLITAEAAASSSNTNTSCLNTTHQQTIYTDPATNETTAYDITACAYGCSAGACNEPTSDFSYTFLVVISLLGAGFGFIYMIKILNDDSENLKALFMFTGLFLIISAMLATGVIGEKYQNEILNLANTLSGIAWVMLSVVAFMLMYFAIKWIERTIQLYNGGK